MPMDVGHFTDDTASGLSKLYQNSGFDRELLDSFTTHKVMSLNPQILRRCNWVENAKVRSGRLPHLNIGCDALCKGHKMCLARILLKVCMIAVFKAKTVISRHGILIHRHSISF